MSLTRTIVLLATLVTATANVGCRTQRDVVEAHRAGEGTSVVYAADQETAIRAVVDVLREEGASLVDPRLDRGYIAAEFGMSFFSYGTVVGVWSQPEANGTNVTVITLRRLATGAVTRLTEETFHERLGERLVRVP